MASHSFNPDYHIAHILSCSTVRIIFLLRSIRGTDSRDFYVLTAFSNSYENENKITPLNFSSVLTMPYFFVSLPVLPHPPFPLVSQYLVSLAFRFMKSLRQKTRLFFRKIWKIKNNEKITVKTSGFHLIIPIEPNCSHTFCGLLRKLIGKNKSKKSI